MRSDAWAGELSWCNIQVWFSHYSSLKRATTSLCNCLLSDRVVQVHNGQCLSNKKNNTLIFDRLIRAFFLVEETLSPSTATIASCKWNVFVKFLPSLKQNFTNTHTHTHTHTHTLCSSSSCIVTWSLIRRTACALAHFIGCSSTTNAPSETGQMAVCCQNLTLGALSSRSALSLLVGALFKKFGHFLYSLVFLTKKGHLRNMQGINSNSCRHWFKKLEILNTLSLYIYSLMLCVVLYCVTSKLPPLFMI